MAFADSDIDAMQVGPDLDKLVEVLTDKWFGWDGEISTSPALPYSSNREVLEGLQSSLMSTDPRLFLSGPFYFHEDGLVLRDRVGVVGQWVPGDAGPFIHIDAAHGLTAEAPTYGLAACRVIVKAMLLALRHQQHDESAA